MADKSGAAQKQATEPQAKAADVPKTATTGAQVQAASPAAGGSTNPTAPGGSSGVTISNCSHHCNHPSCCCPVKKPPAKKKVFFKKAAPALTSAEIERMIDLGLGRGIDATNSKPWANKSAFQVRRVMAEGVLGTEEGGSLQSYEREVSSVVSHQTSMKASVVVPQAPVEIGIDAEQSRSVSSTRRTLGKKVVNRSISFHSDFSDIPVVNDRNKAQVLLRARTFKPPTTEGKAEAEATAQQTAQDESVADLQLEFLTFEQRLSKWIVKRMMQRQEMVARELRAAGMPVGKPRFVLDDTFQTDPTSTLACFAYNSDEEEKKKIIHDCYDFVQHFRITHYVSTIELGAMEYRVFSETDFNSTIAAGGALGIEKLVNLSLSQKSTSRKFRKASDVKTIGKMSAEGKVSRGTHDEAVVGIKVQPISTLVKFPYLQLALQRSLVYYMEEQSDRSSGPFLVAFGSERSIKFWSVNDDDYSIRGTTNPQNASLFFIISSDSGQHPYEFHIAYMGDNHHTLKKRVSSLTPLTQKPVQAIPRYLDAGVSVFGTNSGPLYLEYHVSERSRLLLYGRVANEKGPVSTTTWTQGRDMFFINCARRRLKRDGYIAMRRRRRRNGEVEWMTACVPRKDDHNERNRLMLFRLLPAWYRDDPTLLDAEPDKDDATASGDASDPFNGLNTVESLDKKLERYGKGSVPDAFRAPPSPLPEIRYAHKKPAQPSSGDDGTLTLPELSDFHYTPDTSDPPAAATAEL